MKRDLGRLKRLHSVYNTFHGKKSECPHLPIISNIELTSRCNLNCRKCARSRVQATRGFGDMPFNRYEEILDRYPRSIERIKLFQHGEPTMYPRLVDACQLASESPHVKYFWFATNGNFRTSLLQELFEVGLSGITFSFDGVSKEVYEDTCRGGDFDLVKANIQEACRLRDLKYHNVKIALTIVRSSHTEKELSLFNEKWSPHLKRKVFVLDLHDWTSDNVDPKQLEYMGFKPRRTRPTTCISPWKYSRIYYNGDVVPCCTWLWDPLGNVFREDLYEIWNNESYRGLREDLNEGRGSNEYCSRCYLEPELSHRNPFYPLDRKFLSTVGDAVKRRITNKLIVPGS